MSNPLLDQFIAEAADLLDEVDMGLLRLEQDPGDLDLINEIFRAAHTLKGSSGLFDLPALTHLTHAAEDLLDAVRSGEVDLDAGTVDVLLAGFDQVRTWMGDVERSETLPVTAAATGHMLAERLRSGLGTTTSRGPVTAPLRPGGRPAGPPAVAPDWVRRVPTEALQTLSSWLTTTGASVRAVHYTPDAGCFFRGEDPVHLVRAIPAIEHLDIRAAGPLPGIATLEEFDCVLQFTVLTRSEPQEIAHVFRYVPDQVQVADLDGPALARLLAHETAEPLGGTGATASTEHSLALDVLVAQQVLLTSALPGDGWEARIRSAAASAAIAAALAGLDPAPGEHHLQNALESSDVAALLDWTAELQASLGLVTPPGSPTPSAPDGALSTEETPTLETDGDTGREPGTEVAAHDGAVRSQRLLKVEQIKIDRLLELAGELVVAKNGLPFVAAHADQGGQRELASRIKDEYAVISRVSEELQQAVMDVRMLAVSVAFARIPRLVRDLSRKLGKSVRLVQEGEDAAADKDVIEGLAEPLVHLVRNSLDHGIETPQEREAAGKPLEAVLTLRAIPDGDAVVIEVADDGRGIDARAVRQKAYDRGLITAAACDSMTEEDTIGLLFEPGFSTAQEVSDVSGRGVGMDAVRASIEALGGFVTMTTRHGEGTTVSLRLPLTMAVSQVLLLVAGDQRFGIQVSDVIETVSMPADNLQTVAGHPVLVLREDIVPLAWLASLLDLPTQVDRQDLTVLIVRTPTGPLGLVVDRFQQPTDVILKPLEGLLAGNPGYCGTAMLGDGLVLLVLDVKELNDRAHAAR